MTTWPNLHCASFLKNTRRIFVTRQPLENDRPEEWKMMAETKPERMRDPLPVPADSKNASKRL